MVRSMDWQPSEELIAWGNEHFGGMPVDSVWSPDDSGVQYRKMSETSYALIFMLNHPLAQEHHESSRSSWKHVATRWRSPMGWKW